MYDLCLRWQSLELHKPLQSGVCFVIQMKMATKFDVVRCINMIISRINYKV